MSVLRAIPLAKNGLQC